MSKNDPAPSDIITARRAIGLIDLTDLDDRTTEERVTALCQRAVQAGTAAVCVWPDFVALAAGLLADTAVRVATVVNFPTGDERPFAIGTVTELVLADGADEIDVVLPYRAWLAGDTEWVATVLHTARSATGEHTLKVILETGELRDLNVIESASRFAIEHGADFVKTSTGKSPVSATIDAARVMLGTIRESERPVGIKPSGGIRTLADAAEYLALADEIMGPDWATPQTFRFGASGLLDALLAVIDGRVDSAAEPTDY